MDFLNDQAKFMAICGQTVGENNHQQTVMYETLLAEEHTERLLAISAKDEVEEFDADLDMLVVHLGRMLSRWPVEMIQYGWQEVMRSNLSKAERCILCKGIGHYSVRVKMPEYLYNDEYYPVKTVSCERCSSTGFVVNRREDGKILKPDTYSPPDLKAIVERYRK